MSSRRGGVGVESSRHERCHQPMRRQEDKFINKRSGGQMGIISVSYRTIPGEGGRSKGLTVVAEVESGRVHRVQPVK